MRRIIFTLLCPLSNEFMIFLCRRRVEATLTRRVRGQTAIVLTMRKGRRERKMIFQIMTSNILCLLCEYTVITYMYSRKYVYIYILLSLFFDATYMYFLLCKHMCTHYDRRLYYRAVRVQIAPWKCSLDPSGLGVSITLNSFL